MSVTHILPLRANGFAFASRLKAWRRAAQRRRCRATLNALSNQTLDDIGLQRSDIARMA